MIFGMVITTEAQKPVDKTSPELFINTQGVSICERNGDLCGTGKSTMRIVGFEVENPDTLHVTGSADVSIKVKGISNDGSNSKTENIEPPKPLSFVFHNITWNFLTQSNELTMKGTTTSSGEIIQYLIVGKQQEKTTQLAIPDWFFKYDIKRSDGTTITGFTIGTGTDILELVDKSAEK